MSSKKKVELPLEKMTLAEARRRVSEFSEIRAVAGTGGGAAIRPGKTQLGAKSPAGKEKR